MATSHTITVPPPMADVLGGGVQTWQREYATPPAGISEEDWNTFIAEVRAGWKRHCGGPVWRDMMVAATVVGIPYLLVKEKWAIDAAEKAARDAAGRLLNRTVSSTSPREGDASKLVLEISA